jgi:hypothetical protein
MIVEVLDMVFASAVAVVILSVWFSDDWRE